MVSDIRSVKKTDPYTIFKQVALIHEAEISEGFLSTLGTTFLARMYKSLALSPHSFLLIAQENENVVGFICGGFDTGKAMKQFMFAQGLFVIFLILPKVLSIKSVKKIFETIFYPKKQLDTVLPDAEILNFCVDRNAQRKGIGKMLFNALCERFRNAGVHAMKIVTGESQKKAQAFYESLSARKVAELEVHKGTKSYIYTFDLRD
jgi:ribosomal protein S18 acetylase RimI-like enzyme